MKGVELEPAPEMPASINPVVILSGSDYQMGYQYGQQAAQHIGMRLDAYWASTLKQFSYDEVLSELAEAQKCIKQYTPEAIEMMKGIANGATAAGYKMSYFDVLLLNAQPWKPVPEEEELASSGCSGFAAWGSTTKDGSLICGDSADGAFTPTVIIVAFPDNGNSYISVAFVVGTLISHPGINNRGLAFVHHGGGGRLRRASTSHGLPRRIAPLHTLRFANNANEAKDMQLAYTTRSGGQWVDIHGNNWVIECNEAKTVRQAGDYGETDFIYSTNNAICRELGHKGEEYIEHGGWFEHGRWGRCSIPRNLEIWNMLRNYHGQVDLDFVEMMWRFPGNLPPYPRDVKTYIATRGEGWDQMICHLLNENVTIMLPDDGNKGKMYVCAGPAGRVAYPVDPTGYSFPIAATHTFYELTLASSPAAVVGAAKTTANNYIAEAYDKLMRLNYSDTGYAVLNELFSLANTEYYQGYIANNKGLLTGGNEALLHFAEAATTFTRSQAHAKQVLHALAPPATCPSDIKGLEDKPWFGDWGGWATRTG